MADDDAVPKGAGAVESALVDSEDVDVESSPVVEAPGGRPACFRSTFQEILFVLTATMATAMTAFLAGSVTVTSSFVGRSLNMTTAEITWLSSATSLTCGAFLLSFGRLADMFGRKSLFVGSMLLFAVVCLGAGFARNAITVDVLCGVLGLFGAAATPPAVGLLGVIYHKPGTRKNAAFACFSGGNPLGFVAGTIFGGIAATVIDWRASFWLVAIIFIFFTVIAIYSVPSDSTDKEPINRESLKKFDVVGTFLTVAGISLFSAGLTLGGTAPDGWKTGYVIAFLVVGFVLLAAFVRYEFWFSYPLMPMGIWKDRNFTLVLSIQMLGFIAFSPASFFIALYFQDVWHMSALMAAVHLLPMAINGLLVNIFAGLVLHRISNKTLLWVATLAYIISTLLFAVNTKHSSYWAFCFPALTLQVVGADLEFNVANMYVMSSMPASQQSVAGGIFQTTTKLCMTLSFGIATAIYDSVEKNPTLPSYWDAATQPYAAVFWMCFACAALSMCLVPFVTIGTQGGKEKAASLVTTAGESDRDEKAATEESIATAGAMVAQALPSVPSEK